MSDQAPEAPALKTIDEIFDLLQAKADKHVQEQRLVEPGWIASNLVQLVHAVQDRIAEKDLDVVLESVSAAIMSAMVLHNQTKALGRKIVEHVVEQAVASDRGGLILPPHLR